MISLNKSRCVMLLNIRYGKGFPFPSKKKHMDFPTQNPMMFQTQPTSLLAVQGPPKFSAGISKSELDKNGRIQVWDYLSS